jgi:hypothetical protein
MKINKYTINYKGKKYFYNAETAVDAFEKFSKRKVFGQDLIWNSSLLMYDAETRGEQWAQYRVNQGETNGSLVMVEIVKTEEIPS